MPPRNSARTEKIVEAAAHLFARQGYHGTSTRQIAHLAEVSEHTLFRHFDHKEDLFWSALRSRVAGLTIQWDLLEGIGDGDVPEVVLPKIVELLLNSVNSRPEVLRLIAVASLELQGKAEAVWRDLLSPFFSMISKYLAACVEKGEVLEVNPTLLTASLMAMAFMHPQLSKLTDGNSKSQADNQDAVRVHSKFWIDLLSARLPVSSSPIAQTVVPAST